MTSPPALLQERLVDLLNGEQERLHLSVLDSPFRVVGSRFQQGFQGYSLQRICLSECLHRACCPNYISGCHCQGPRCHSIPALGCYRATICLWWKFLCLLQWISDNCHQRILTLQAGKCGECQQQRQHKCYGSMKIWPCRIRRGFII